MCETACAPSTSTRAPWRWAISTISRAGVTVPSAFETWVNETSCVRGPSSFSYSSRRTWPRSSTGATRSRAPFSAQSSCQGTMFAWCSSQVMTISSPFADVAPAPALRDEVDAPRSRRARRRSRRVGGRVQEAPHLLARVLVGVGRRAPRACARRGGCSSSRARRSSGGDRSPPAASAWSPRCRARPAAGR